MELVTKQIRKELNANWANNLECEGAMDFKPVVKYFMPFGAGKWLITEMDDDEERMFGLCDLGFGTPEMGYVMLNDLESLKPNLERDYYFKPNKTLLEYWKESTEKGYINA